MKKELWVNSTLTLLTMFALSACGSSGGKAPSAMPASKPTPEAEQQKPSALEVEKKEEKEPEQSQANLSAEKPKAEEPKAEKPQQPKVVPVAEQPKKEEQKQPQATQPVEKPKAEKTQESKVVPVVEQPKREEQKQPQVTQPVEKPKAEEPKAEKPKQPKVDPVVEQPKKEEQKQPQVTQSVEKPKSEEPKAEQLQQPKVISPVEKPQVDNSQANQLKIEKLEQPLVQVSDKEVFDRLSLSDKNGTVDSSLVKLVFNDNKNEKVELAVLPPHNLVGSPKIETLRDSAGTLIGYYGYARVSENKKNIDKEDYANLHAFYLQDADRSQQQRPVGMSDIKYSGKMLYQYNAVPGQLEAKVSAIYHAREKKMSMDIHDNSGGVWNLHQDKMVRSSNHVNINEDGSVGGYLFFKNNQGDKARFNGNFNGGFYGKDGSVLTGRASFEDRRDGGWEGVIGATATAEKADKANQ